ncbi:MAG: Lin0512 family protein [Pseudomonadota bacterium]
MTEFRRIILEMGTGTDLHGGDYTKAAKRAVHNALHHSSLPMFHSLSIDPNSMEIELRLAAQDPEKIDLDAVAATLPYGKVNPVAVKGGLNFPDSTTGADSIIVNAGIIVRLPL